MCGVLTAANEIRESANDFDTSFTISWDLRTKSLRNTHHVLRSSFQMRRAIEIRFRESYYFQQKG